MDFNFLVIDDDEINLFIMNKLVEKTGYKTTMVSKTNGKSGYEYLQELVNNGQPLPKLIFVDVNMPVLNGWEFLEHYMNLNIQENVAIYMLSSSVYEVDLNKAGTYKFIKGFISKPISIENLKGIFEDGGAEAA